MHPLANCFGADMKSILDSSFRYVPSAETNLSKTFARLRREQRKADKERSSTVPTTKVTPIKQYRTGEAG
jgi:hypothetical protein